MRFSDAFRETLFRFKLKGTDIAERSGVGKARISQFRNGHDINVSTLEKILMALPVEAQKYLLTLVSQDELPTSGNDDA